MSDLTSLGYPQGYHMGLSAILWWISIAIIAILGFLLYLNARKSDLINVKEMLRAKGLGYMYLSIYISSIQVVVFYPDNFLLFDLIGEFLSMSFLTLYFYYWEKYLTSLKRIPTISMGAASVISCGGLITYIFFPDLVIILLDILVIITLILTAIAFLLYICLIFAFSRHVKEVSTTVSGIWIVGMVLVIISYSFEHPPGVKIFPPFVVFYITPIAYILGFSMAFYGINTLFAQISTYYAQTQKCAVHRGTIEKGTIMHFCPSCGITYCDTCFNQVIKNDGCWNCRKGADPEIEKEWKIEQAVEVKKDAKSKSKLTHKNPK